MKVITKTKEVQTRSLKILEPVGMYDGIGRIRINSHGVATEFDVEVGLVWVNAKLVTLLGGKESYDVILSPCRQFAGCSCSRGMAGLTCDHSDAVLKLDQLGELPLPVDAATLELMGY